MKKLLFLFASAVIVSCSSGDQKNEETAETPKDSVSETEIVKDTATDVPATAATDGTTAEGSSIESVEKAGGLSFCDCVKKQEELDKQLQTAPDSEVEALMKKMDELKNLSPIHFTLYNLLNGLFLKVKKRSTQSNLKSASSKLLNAIHPGFQRRSRT